LPKKLAILGSTGSIGSQALTILRQYPGRLKAEVLTAQNNADLLIEQALEFRPRSVVIGRLDLFDKVKSALAGIDIEVLAGVDAINEVVKSREIDMVLVALVGFAGLKPVLNAIEAGKNIALANKECLVVAGELVTQTAKEKNVQIIPVDSEHSAIFQCLLGEDATTVEKIYLTASGGPFCGKNHQFLSTVTKTQALKHPNWNMGKKISIDSATMMNKGLEVIEAKWLFNLKPHQIEIIIHPQSIIHSFVQFIDGSMKAQMGLPDMRGPIHFAFSYPGREVSDFKRFSFSDYQQLTFCKPDYGNFRNLALAYQAMETGGNMPCILNAANEIAVEAFLGDQIKFLQIHQVIEQCMKSIGFITNPCYEDYLLTDSEVKKYARVLINNLV
jgi:1-deoxy-D-xylulose-5-phosphate reductoisomerase